MQEKERVSVTPSGEDQKFLEMKVTKSKAHSCRQQIPSWEIARNLEIGITLGKIGQKSQAYSRLNLENYVELDKMFSEGI